MDDIIDSIMGFLIAIYFIVMIAIPITLVAGVIWVIYLLMHGQSLAEVWDAIVNYKIGEK